MTTEPHYDYWNGSDPDAQEKWGDKRMTDEWRRNENELWHQLPSCYDYSPQYFEGRLYRRLRPVPQTEPVASVRDRVEQAVGGSYEMLDGRKFWIDAPVAKEIAGRVAAIIDKELAQTDAASDTKRLDWLERDLNDNIRAYVNGSDFKDETRYWRHKKGLFLSTGHPNTLRGAIDAAASTETREV